MPIKVKHDLPAREVIEKENIFIMDETRAISQDIRPLEIVMVNLMPLKEDTEIQMLRSLSNTPLQVNLTFIVPAHHESKNTPVSHLDQFYQTFEEIKDKKYDGMIITGAPIEMLEFEEVDFWEELVQIMDWSETNVTSTIFLCWAAQAAFYHFYGLKKRELKKKISGVFQHKVHHRKTPLVRGFDDVFWAPHSRNTEVAYKDIVKTKDITILADSDEVGFFLAIAEEGKKIFVMGHPEYDRNTLDYEFKRDTKKGLNPEIPKNYYPDDNPANRPLLTWRGHANTLYTNWLNYYVYQVTPFDINDVKYSNPSKHNS
ncbi:MAG: homoserine O-succinyltransferase [Parasporobacterium sp.]|nr:homoserine O-succinyltransferase [Parasporobacterium sp.]